MEDSGDQTNRSEITFPNVLAVVGYLHAQGWKVGKSAAYLHCQDGRLKARKDGFYHSRDVMKYARLHLKRVAAGSGRTSSHNQEILNERRVEAETKRAEAEVRIAEAKAWAIEGKYMEREKFELEVAARAGILYAGLKSWIQTEATNWIRTTDGDVTKTGELIKLVTDGLVDHMNTYARPADYLVIFDGEEEAEDAHDKAPDSGGDNDPVA